MKNSFLSLILSIIGLTLYAQPTTITIESATQGEDAPITNYAPDINYETSELLRSMAWTNSGATMDFRSLLWFDLSSIPADAHIAEAKLSLYYYHPTDHPHSSTSGPNTSQLLRITESWDVTTVTWNNQPATTTEAAATVPMSMSPFQDYESIDVTELIRAIRQAENYGFMLKLANEQKYRTLFFASSEHTDATKHPRLTITYSSTEGTAPIAPSELAVEETSSLNLSLTWLDNADNEEKYVVEKSVHNNTNYQVVSELPSNSSSTTINTDLESRTRYFFRIKAIEANGYYSYSNETSITTGAVAMNEGDATVCGVYHYDSGIEEPYIANENYTQVLSPSEAAKKLKMSFNSFDLSSGDKLRIYNGNSTSAEMLVELTSSSSLPTQKIVGTNDMGQLTLHFTSDDEVTKKQGWEAYLHCVDPVFPPEAFSATSETVGEVVLAWNDTLANETGFEIQRSTSGGSYSIVHTTAANATSYTQTDLTYGEEYNYRIRTTNADSHSPWSEPVTVTVMGPVAPSNLQLNSESQNSITLTWQDNYTNETAYVIERSVGDESNYQELTTTAADVVTYTDEGLTFGETYYYRVKTVENTYESGYCTPASFIAGAKVMSATTLTNCGYYLLDPGGMENYDKNLSITTVLAPVDATQKTKITFESFDLETNDDYLRVYDGATTDAPLLASLTGNSIPDSINATNAEGKLTVVFTSDNYTERPGFQALVNCVTIPEVPTDLTATDSTTSSITLGWTDNATTETGYAIYRATSLNGTYTQIATTESDAVAYTDTELNFGTNYYYKLASFNAEGFSAQTPALASQTTGPLVPTNLSAVSNNQNSITLTWEDQTIAETAFIIERSDQGANSFTQIGETGSDVTTYTDETVVFGTVYDYRVKTVQESMETDYCTPISFMAGSVVMTNEELTRCGYYLLDPGGIGNYGNDEYATTILRPTAPDQKIKIVFESFNLENNYDDIRVYDGPSTNSEFLIELTGSSLPDSIIATNAEGAITLLFDSDGSVVRSGFQASISCVYIPPTPTELMVTDSTINSMTLAWTDNSEYEEGFLLYRSETIDGTYTEVGSVAANTTSFVDNGLTHGTQYFYKIVAFNQEGFSELSAPISGHTTGPIMPYAIQAVSNTNTSITLTWEDESINETGFVIERSVLGENSYSEIGQTSTDVLTYTDETVTFGAEYDYRIKTVQDAIESAYSEAISFKAGAVVMNASTLARCNYYLLDPGALSNYANNQATTMVLQPTDPAQKVKLSFEAFDLESSNDYLRIYNGSTTDAELLFELTGSSLPANFNATNTEGALTVAFSSNASTTASGFQALVACVTIPEAPTNLQATDSTFNSVTLTWTDNASSETQFVIYRSAAIDGSYSEVGTVAADVVTYTDTELDYSTQYFYKVAAKNADASSQLTEAIAVQTRGPIAPESLTAVSNSQTTVTLTWTDNYTEETGFIVERSLSGQEAYSEIGLNAANDTTFTDESAEFGITYQYRVKTIQEAMASDYCSPITIMAGAVIMANEELTRCGYYLLDPGGVQNYGNNEYVTMVLRPTDPTQKVKLNFENFNLESGYDDLRIYDGVSTNDEFLVELTGSSLPDSINANNAEGALTLFFDTDGSVTRSGFQILVSCVDIPASPTDLAVTDSSYTSISLSWMDNASIETGYAVLRSTSANGTFEEIASLPENSSTFTDETVDYGTRYYYQVAAFNENGYSLRTQIASSETLGPITPTALTAESNTNTSIEIGWTHTTDEETQFIIERSLSDQGSYVEVGRVDADVTTYIDETVTFGQVYDYQLKTVQDDMISTPSEPVKFMAGAVVMTNTEVARESLYLLDPGGLNNYSDNLEITTVLSPTEANKKLKINFSSFDVERDDDFVRIYNGSSTEAELLAEYTGYSIPDSINATNAEGALTVVFDSDGWTDKEGFVALISSIDIPAAPTQLEVSDSTFDAITIQWVDNASIETGFAIYRSTNENGTYSRIAQVGSDMTTFTDNDVIHGTRYFYKVAAFNEQGYSDKTAPCSARTLGPVIPQNVTIASNTQTSITLSWEDLSVAETGYVIERSVYAGNNYTQVATVSADVVTYTDETVEFGTKYSYRIKTIQDALESDFSNTVHYMAGSVVMSEADEVTRCGYYLLDPSGIFHYENNERDTTVLYPTDPSKKVKLSFEAFNTHSNYDFVRIYDGTSTEAELLATYSGESIPAAVNAFNAEGALTVEFYSNNYYTYSGFQALVSCVSIPVAPTNLEATGSTSSSVSLAWTDNASNETGFVIFRAESMNGTYARIDTVAANETVFTDTELTGATQYFYMLQAINEEGHSQKTEPAMGQTVGPFTPTGLAAESPTNTTIVVTWEDTSIGETGFVIERADYGEDNYIEVGQTTANEVTFTDEGLTFGNSYQYRVKSVLDDLSSDFSEPFTFIAGALKMTNTELYKCNYYLLDPAGLNSNYANNEDVTMVLYPTEDNARVILHFEYAFMNSWDVLEIYNGPTSSEDILAEINYENYPDSIYSTHPSGALTLRFTSNNSGTNVGFNALVTCQSLPEAPTDLSITSHSAEKIHLAWTDNANDEDQYFIFRSKNNGDFSIFAQLSSDVTKFTDEDVAAGNTFAYKVAAKRGPVMSNFSNEVSVSLAVGVDEIETTETLVLYPNPVLENLQVNLNKAEAGQVSISIRSVSGSLVYTNHYWKDSENFSKEIEVKHLSQGVYIITVELGTNKFQSKFMKR
jgi:titin